MLQLSDTQAERATVSGENMFRMPRSQAVLASTSPKMPAFTSSTDTGFTVFNKFTFGLYDSYLELRVSDSA